MTSSLARGRSRPPRSIRASFHLQVIKISKYSTKLRSRPCIERSSISEELTELAPEVLRESANVLVDLKPLFVAEVEVAAVADCALGDDASQLDLLVRSEVLMRRYSLELVGS